MLGLGSNFQAIHALLSRYSPASTASVVATCARALTTWASGSRHMPQLGSPSLSCLESGSNAVPPETSAQSLVRPIPGSAHSSSAWGGRRNLHSTPGVVNAAWDPAAHGDTGTVVQVYLAEAGLLGRQAQEVSHHSPPSRNNNNNNEPWRAELADKVAELCREGLAPEAALQLFRQHANPRRCSLEDVFRPNLRYLRSLLGGCSIVRLPYEPVGLTPLGRLLRTQPRDMAWLLSRSPAQAVQLDAWVSQELGVARQQLADTALTQPTVLYVPVEKAQAVAGYLREELGLSQGQVASLLLREPRMFGQTPQLLRRNLEELRQALGICEDAAVLDLVLRQLRQQCWQPLLLATPLPELPGVLSQLDRLFGRQGAGAELVRRSPVVATLSVAKLATAVQALRNGGYDEAGIREVVGTWGQGAPEG